MMRFYEIMTGKNHEFKQTIRNTISLNSDPNPKTKIRKKLKNENK